MLRITAVAKAFAVASVLALAACATQPVVETELAPKLNIQEVVVDLGRKPKEQLTFGERSYAKEFEAEVVQALRARGTDGSIPARVKVTIEQLRLKFGTSTSGGATGYFEVENRGTGKLISGPHDFSYVEAGNTSQTSLLGALLVVAYDVGSVANAANNPKRQLKESKRMGVQTGAHIQKLIFGSPGS